MIIGSFDPLKGEQYGVIDEAGVARPSIALPLDEHVRRLYRDMVMIRAFDDKALALQRQGRIGTFAQIKGNEAIQAGAALAMQPEDWLVPSYRESGIIHLRGVSMGSLYLFWAGNEIGSQFPESTRILPVAVPVGSQPLHAVGIGWAAKIRGERLVVLTCFGDGATSEGECHEALNFAGTFRAPVVFLCTNNQFAISVPRSRQTAARSIAEKAMAYGFEGIMVDGMDAVAVYQVVGEALSKARAGEGPTLIEAVTYRLCDHTTADDATLYQDPKELEMWWAREPVARLKKYLVTRGLWSAADDEALARDVKAAIDEAVGVLDRTPAQTPQDIFHDTFATVPPQLAWQEADLLRTQRSEKGKG